MDIFGKFGCGNDRPRRFPYKGDGVLQGCKASDNRACCFGGSLELINHTSSFSGEIITV